MMTKLCDRVIIISIYFREFRLIRTLLLREISTSSLKLAGRLKRERDEIVGNGVGIRKYLKILSSEYRIPPIQFPIIPLIPA